MTFPTAPGYGNLPNGNYAPTIWSPQFLKYFSAYNVAGEITDTTYSSEIAQKGDTVNIPIQPVVTVSDYVAGGTLTAQAITDNKVQLVVDQAKAYCFTDDAVQSALSAADYSAAAVDSAAKEMKTAYDINILTAMVAGATGAAALGTNGSPITIGFGGTNNFTPLDYMARFQRMLDENNVDETDRFFVASPAFWEKLRAEDSKYIDSAVIGGNELSVIRNTKLFSTQKIHGFMCFKSNNIPATASSHISVLAGSRKATVVANKLTQVRRQELVGTQGFGFINSGLMVWGRKVIRPEALFTGTINGSTGFTDA